MPNFRVAMTGVGHWHATMHRKAVAAAGAELVAVTDPNPETASAFAEGSGATACQDLPTLMQRFDADLVIALGEPTQVVNTALWLLDHGVACVVEKPIGLSRVDLHPLERAAARPGAFASVPLVNRLSELWAMQERLRGEGRLGAPVHAHFRVINGPASRYQALGVPWMCDPARSGGGCLRNLGIHAADAAIAFLGTDDVAIRGVHMLHNPSTSPIETFVAAILEARGAVVTIEAGYSFTATRGGDTEWRVTTENAYLMDRNGTLRTVTLDDGQDATRAIPSVADRYDAYLADVVERLRDGRPPGVPLSAYASATGLVDRLYRAAAEESA